jgi:hypothetical protein
MKWLSASSRSVRLNRSMCGVGHAQLQGQLLGDPVLTPLGVVGADAPDESDVLGGDAGTAWLPALPGPEALMATPVPRNHGGRLDQNQGRAPVPPDFRERDPERPPPGLEPGPLLGSGVSRELLTKS